MQLWNAPPSSLHSKLATSRASLPAKANVADFDFVLVDGPDVIVVSGGAVSGSGSGGGGGAVAVPVSGMSVELLALLVMLTVALCVPTAVGAYATLTKQFSPGESWPGCSRRRRA